MTGRLAAKRIVVTGAAGGIGSAAARAFAAEGATVGLLDLESDRLRSITAELGAAATPLPADLGDPVAVGAAFASWSSAHRGLDALYVCAGVQLLELDGRLTDVDVETWDRTHRVNARGVFLTLRAALPIMAGSGGGSVIVCGSPTALTMSGAGTTAYAASKAAAMALARVVAADYARDGIRANVIVPGTTATPLIADLLADPERRRELEEGTPLGRIGTPEELAGIAVYLASDESAYATGATFTVDGGLTQR